MRIIPISFGPIKPAQGAPCNGCGWCCHEEVCQAGQIAYSTTEAPCPGIILRDGIVRCEVVLAEQRALAAGLVAESLIQRGLGIGLGCDAEGL